MQSTFSKRFTIIPVDSTQISNPPPGLLIRSVLALRRLAIFIGLLIRHRPDGVLLFTAVGVSFIEKSLMAWVSRIFGCTSFIFPRGGRLIDQTEQSHLMFFIVSTLLKGADVFLSQGPSWSDFAVKRMGFNPSRVHEIPNWTATEHHLKIGSQRDFDANRKPPCILFVGWLEEFKGVFDLLEAAHNLVKQGHIFKLTFAGSGHAEEPAKGFVKKNHLENVITFVGWVDSEDIGELLSANDIFVLPSWAEGLPNSMIEAMAGGLAVVVTNVGMIPDFVKDKKHALLVPPKDAKSLEEALSLLITDAELRCQIAINGFEMASREFSVEPVIGKLGDVIEAAILR
ncbi:hypothetical protein Tel_08620 [Candidatus Tenderia electrophaga]|uniref:Glycosyl transferase family 1 domain-containing protein n=1 Tax=Candidatus Tenderia electrophaga TaxID=1748243 RepID=A0A0S2TDJ9_9GAMM|nr:hypothetical protein Tel_08620 [Candidatus Tenderia electrophaga]